MPEKSSLSQKAFFGESLNEEQEPNLLPFLRNLYQARPY
jgi:hypothetical protein